MLEYYYQRVCNPYHSLPKLLRNSRFLQRSPAVGLRGWNETSRFAQAIARASVKDNLWLPGTVTAKREASYDKRQRKKDSEGYENTSRGK